MPSSSMGGGDVELTQLVRQSVAPATWTAYGKAWDAWLGCAGDSNYVSSPQERLRITLQYLLLLRRGGSSGTLACSRITGVSFHFQLRGWENIGLHFLVSRALRGWRKERVSSESRRPVSYHLLQSLLGALPGICSSPYETLLFSTVFGLAFFGAFRACELVPLSRNKAGGLQFSDIVLGPDSLRVRVRRSKTDQFGRGSWVHLRPSSGPICPVLLVKGFLEQRPLGDVFFIHEDGSPVTRFQFSSLFRRCLSASGVEASEYGLHSFRIGAATEAVRAGLPEEQVMRLGRWRSQCYVSYVRPELML